MQKGKIVDRDREAALSRIATETSLDRLAEAVYVVEAIVENFDAKRTIFERLERIR